MKSVEATQNGKSLEANGGLDLTKQLKLAVNFTNNYKKEIKDHKFDFFAYQYTDDDGPCDWYELDTEGAT